MNAFPETYPGQPDYDAWLAYSRDLQDRVRGEYLGRRWPILSSDPFAAPKPRRAVRTVQTYQTLPPAPILAMPPKPTREIAWEEKTDERGPTLHELCMELGKGVKDKGCTKIAILADCSSKTIDDYARLRRVPSSSMRNRILAFFPRVRLPMYTTRAEED
jgi:hypothetical protein